jgi:hypothetical protein
MKETRSLSRAPTPATLRLQGLATLLTPCSPRVPAGLVSCRRRSWDSPFEAFPLSRVSRPSGREAPTCRFAVRLSHRAEARRERQQPRLLGFAPGTSPSLPHASEDPRRNRLLPWVFGPSRGLSPTAWNRLPPTLLSRAWLIGYWYRELPAPQSIDRPSTKPVPVGPAAPLRVFAPFRPHAFGRPPVRAMCSPRGRRRVAAASAPLCGPSTVPTSMVTFLLSVSINTFHGV